MQRREHVRGLSLGGDRITNRQGAKTETGEMRGRGQLKGEFGQNKMARERTVLSIFSVSAWCLGPTYAMEDAISK